MTLTAETKIDLFPFFRSACADGKSWASGKSLAEIWKTCERPDWLIWLAFRLDVPVKKLALCACDCARMALVYVPAGETRPQAAIEAAEKCAKNQTPKNQDAALDAAWAARDAGDAARYARDRDAARAAYRAALAASAARAAAAAKAAVCAARAAAWAAGAARAAMNKKCADAVRARITLKMLKMPK